MAIHESKGKPAVPAAGHRSPPYLWAVVAPLLAAASVGSLAAILGSFRQLNPVVVQRTDGLTLICGVAGGVAGWLLGRGLGRLGQGTPSVGPGSAGLRRRVVAGLLLLGMTVIAGFAVATVGLPDSRRGDMIVGALLALLVLSAGGIGLWRLSRIFGRPDEP